LFVICNLIMSNRLYLPNHIDHNYGLIDCIYCIIVFKDHNETAKLTIFKTWGSIYFFYFAIIHYIHFCFLLASLFLPLRGYFLIDLKKCPRWPYFKLFSTATNDCNISHISWIYVTILINISTILVTLVSLQFNNLVTE